MKEHCISQANSMAKFLDISLEPQQVEDYTMCREDKEFNGLCDQVILYATLTEEQKPVFKKRFDNIDFKYLG